MISLQKRVAIAITALSAVTLIGNIARPQPELIYHTILSIIEASAGIVIFGLSFFFENVTMKISQVFMILMVGSTTALIPDNEIPQIVFGVILILISINLAWSYDFFDKKPVVALIFSMVILTGIMSFLQSSIITGSATALGIAVAAAIFWTISYDKVRRLQEIARRAMDLAKRADPGDENG